MRRKRRFWTGEEVEVLRSLYPTTAGLVLAKRFNRPLQHVYAKAIKLGLHRLDNPGSIRKGERRGIPYEFKKGVSSWSAGKKVGTRGRSAETQFKKGGVPANTLYDGAIRVRTDWKDKKQRKYQWLRVGKNNKWRELGGLATVLMDTIKKVQEEPKYVDQARTINDTAKTLIDLKRAQIELIRLLKS